MSKELKISNVLDKHLSPIQIDGANVPIELSTEDVRFNADTTFQKDVVVEGDLSILGNQTNINLTDDVFIYSSGQTGFLNLQGLGLSVFGNLYSGDGDSTDNDVFVTLHSSNGYDSGIKLFDTSSLIWTIGRDGSETNELKFDWNAGTGAATKLELDSSGNSKQEGSISIKEKASAIADTAGYGQLWVKDRTPNELYFTTDAGDDIQLTQGTSVVGGGGGGTSRWTTTAGGYKTNNNSALTYYFQFYPNYHVWSNLDTSPTSLSYTDSYAYQFCAAADGTLTNITVTCRASDTGATDPLKFYVFKGSPVNEATSIGLTLIGTTGTITPVANKQMHLSTDISSSNSFSAGDKLWIMLKKDSTSGNQDLYFAVSISGEYD
tara:strand:+ start:5428 stop:6561 length:1134 start_codon:yes stop_codon:yes gene_type:complete